MNVLGTNKRTEDSRLTVAALRLWFFLSPDSRGVSVYRVSIATGYEESLHFQFELFGRSQEPDWTSRPPFFGTYLYDTPKDMDSQVRDSEANL